MRGQPRPETFRFSVPPRLCGVSTFFASPFPTAPSACRATFFISVGSAISDSRSIGHHTPGAFARNPSAEHHQLQLEMGEAVAHQARAALSSSPRPAPRRRRLASPQALRANPSRETPSSRPAAPPPAGGAAARRRRGGRPRRRCHGAAAAPAWANAPGDRPAMPSAAGAAMLAPKGRACISAGRRCRSWRPDPSSPGRNPRRASPASASPPGGGSRACFRAADPSGRRAASPPARYCRPRRSPCGRRRWPRSPPPYRRRCPAGSARPASVSGKRPPCSRDDGDARSDAGCGPGRNSPAPARHAAPRRARPRPRPARPASARGSSAK